MEPIIYERIQQVFENYDVLDNDKLPSLLTKEILLITARSLLIVKFMIHVWACSNVSNEVINN